MYIPNYRDFYQTSLTPIGPQDLSHLENLCHVDSPHWLIALEGKNVGKEREFFTWNIVVYQADKHGCFYGKEPHYISPSFQSFDEAFSTAKEYKQICMDDCFLTSKKLIS